MARRAALGSGQVPGAPIIDVKILVIAALVASPAAYRASQGLLTVDQAITRFLLVTVACMATAMVVRAVWPILAGPVPEKPRAAEAELASYAEADGSSDGYGDASDAEFSPQPE